MRKVTVDGGPLGDWLVGEGKNVDPDPNTTLPGDREFIELLREGKFPDAKRKFPELYNNPHVAFLAQLTRQPAPADSEGAIVPLTERQFSDAMEYLDGPPKR